MFMKKISIQLKNCLKKYIAMAEGEGTSFENPTFKDTWGEDYYGDKTTPFFPNGASTPALHQYQTHVQEEIEMKTMQQAGGQIRLTLRQASARKHQVSGPELLRKSYFRK